MTPLILIKIGSTIILTFLTGLLTYSLFLTTLALPAPSNERIALGGWFILCSALLLTSLGTLLSIW